MNLGQEETPSDWQPDNNTWQQIFVSALIAKSIRPISMKMKALAKVFDYQ